MDIIPYGAHSIEESDIEAVVKVLRGKFLTQGPSVSQLESEVIAYLRLLTHDSTPMYGSVVSNGTSALHLACMALGVGPGQRILVTALSFVASANAALYCGADVEFVDINLRDYCLDLTLLEKKLSGAPKGHYSGVVVVDFAGFVPDLEKLRTLCDQYGVWILEDASHALGGTREDSKENHYAAGACRYADVATFSFHPVKHLAMGEGGMVLTRSKKIHDRVNLLRTHGITKNKREMSRYDGNWYYEMQELGYNYRASDILCELARSQLKRIHSNLERRRAIAERYDRELSALPLVLAPKDKSVRNAYHLYVILTDERQKLIHHLNRDEIFPQVHYIPIPDHPYYVKRYGQQSFPETKYYYNRCLSIPMYHSLSDEWQTRVISSLTRFFRKL